MPLSLPLLLLFFLFLSQPFSFSLSLSLSFSLPLSFSVSLFLVVPISSFVSVINAFSRPLSLFYLLFFTNLILTLAAFVFLKFMIVLLDTYEDSQTIDLSIVHTSFGHLCILIFGVVDDGIIFDGSQAT